MVSRWRKAGHFVQRIEDSISPGIPDIFVAPRGAPPMWVEAKWLARWPVRPATPVRVGMRPEQVVWLTDCWSAGCPCYIMLGVGREVLWFRGQDARTVAQGLPQAELRAVAVCAPL